MLSLRFPQQIRLPDDEDRCKWDDCVVAKAAWCASSIRNHQAPSAVTREVSSPRDFHAVARRYHLDGASELLLLLLLAVVSTVPPLRVSPMTQAASSRRNQDTRCATSIGRSRERCCGTAVVSGTDAARCRRC